MHVDIKLQSTHTLTRSTHTHVENCRHWLHLHITSMCSATPLTLAATAAYQWGCTANNNGNNNYLVSCSVCLCVCVCVLLYVCVCPRNLISNFCVWHVAHATCAVANFAPAPQTLHPPALADLIKEYKVPVPTNPLYSPPGLGVASSAIYGTCWSACNLGQGLCTCENFKLCNSTRCAGGTTVAATGSHATQTHTHTHTRTLFTRRLRWNTWSHLGPTNFN